jgi:hypothetical protein
MSVFGKTRWAIIDCLTGEFHLIDKLPYEIGSGDDVDLKLEGDGILEKHCALRKIRNEYRLVQCSPGAELYLDGQSVETEQLKTGCEYSVVIGERLLLLKGGRNLGAWQAGVDTEQWFILDPALGTPEGPHRFAELGEVSNRQARGPQTIVYPAGSGVGFFLEQVKRAIAGAGARAGVLREGASAVGEDVGAGEIAADVADDGSLTCPVCWLRFDPGDIMHVAVHESLKGDPILGEDAPQRFHATRFNDRGQALDAAGVPCTEMACPHCRRVLPPGFTEVPHYILSIVGDQGAGKSYYLSVLVRVLAVRLYEHFKVVFQDADPAGNALLNEMKRTLFSAQSPDQARLAKTQLEGIMYERLPRYGRIVALPKPFVFSMNPLASDGQRCSVIFYDNAGEHFQPGRDSADSPGAQHVANSAGVMFLFDPFNSPEFRKKIANRGDPQLEKPVVDQQEVILSELKVRIKKLLNLRTDQKIPIPLAFLAGKCDAWMHLLGEDPFRDPIEGGRLNLEAVRYNSGLVRELMLEVSPPMVAISEEMSDSVMFFPVSSFGHAPVTIGPGEYVPDPARLKPVLVEVPPLWLLSRAVPGLIPVSESG